MAHLWRTSQDIVGWVWKLETVGSKMVGLSLEAMETFDNLKLERNKIPLRLFRLVILSKLLADVKKNKICFIKGNIQHSSIF